MEKRSAIKGIGDIVHDGLPRDAANTVAPIFARSLADLLGQLETQLLRSGRAYRRYVSDGKKFLHTRVLRDSNFTIASLLLRYRHMLPGELQEQALDMIDHCDQWLVLWEHHRQSCKPAGGDEFVFGGYSPFPKTAEAALMAAHQKIGLDAQQDWS